MEIPVKCPSGMEITIRDFKVRDEDILANRTLARRGRTMTSLLNAITLSVEDSGPYSFSDGKADWSRALIGDQMWALIQARIATWGGDISFKATCPGCGARLDLAADLSEFKKQALSPEGVAFIESGLLIPFTTSDGEVTCHFKLMKGSDQGKLDRIIKENKTNLMTSLLRYRIESIDGVEPGQLKGFISDLSMRQAREIRDAFDDYDCGVDQTHTLVCDECDHEWEDQVELDTRFLFPKSQKK